MANADSIVYVVFQDNVGNLLGPDAMFCSKFFPKRPFVLIDFEGQQIGMPTEIGAAWQMGVQQGTSLMVYIPAYYTTVYFDTFGEFNNPHLFSALTMRHLSECTRT
jgi:hypothetical protein